MSGRSRRPPKQRCGNCGGDYYGWREGGVCKGCQLEFAPDRSALVEAIKDRRGGSGAPAAPAPVPYDSFPDGF